eukprot:553559_1
MMSNARFVRMHISPHKPFFTQRQAQTAQRAGGSRSNDHGAEHIVSIITTANHPKVIVIEYNHTLATKPKAPTKDGLLLVTDANWLTFFISPFLFDKVNTLQRRTPHKHREFLVKLYLTTRLLFHHYPLVRPLHNQTKKHQ